MVQDEGSHSGKGTKNLGKLERNWEKKKGN